MEDVNRLLPLSKQAIAVVALARSMMRLRVGDQIEPIGMWSDRLRVGRGTVQAALRILEEAEAVRLRSHGRYGTHIEYLDYRRLWEITGTPAVVGSMPLPYTLRYQGLATGLYRAFEQAGLPLQMAYMRGAALRVSGVQQRRYEFAVISLMAANTLLQTQPELEIAVRFGPRSYTGDHVLVFADPQCRALQAGMRVGIDPLSQDQRSLTEAISHAWAVNLVPVNYTQLLNMLTRGELDAAVWNGDEIRERGARVGVVSLQEAGLDLRLENTEAVLVLSRNGLLRPFLEANFDPGIVTATQDSVLAGRENPSF